MSKRFLLSASLLLALAAASPAQEAVAPNSALLQDTAVSGDPDMHALSLDVAWPVGSIVPIHTHPGDEYAVVVEGQITMKSEGRPDRVVTAGQAYHNPRGLVHEARSTGEVAARTIAVLIVDKGRPPVEPVR